MLADLTFVEERASLQDRIGCYQHIGDIFQAFASGVANTIQVIDVCEVDEQAGYVLGYVSIPDTG